MTKRFLSFLLVIIFSIDANAQLSPLEKNKVDELFKQWNGPATPGAALGIIKDGKLIYSRGYGIADLEHDIPITDSTVFYIGSVSKQFVTMCILLLEEQGKLKLDDRIQKYFPDFPEYNAPLTIQNFIHHTSGVRDNLTLWGLAGNDYLDHIDKAEMYQLIKRQKALNFTPGEKYLYSNSCYFILGMLIEKVSGESLKHFAEKNIFLPLGMQHSFFQDDNTYIIKNRAFSYFTDDEGRFKNQILRYDLVGSGGVYSNIRDLYLWDQNFYHNKLGKGLQSLIEKMHTESVLNNGNSTGYAFAIINGNYRGLKTVSHSGALAGYRSMLLRFPDQKMSVVILGNVVPIDVNKLSYSISDVVLEKQLAAFPVIKTTDKANESSEKAKDFVPENTMQYTGNFYSEELDVNYAITEMNNRLYLSIKNKQGVALQAVSPDLFSINNAERLKFERDPQNRIIGFSLDAGRVTDLKFKKK